MITIYGPILLYKQLGKILSKQLHTNFQFRYQKKLTIVIWWLLLIFIYFIVFWNYLFPIILKWSNWSYLGLGFFFFGQISWVGLFEEKAPNFISILGMQRYLHHGKKRRRIINMKRTTFNIWLRRKVWSHFQNDAHIFSIQFLSIEIIKYGGLRTKQTTYWSPMYHSLRILESIWK